MCVGTNPQFPESLKEILDSNLKRTLNHLAKLATIECGFTLKRVRDMTRTYSIMIWLCNNIYKTNLKSIK